MLSPAQRTRTRLRQVADGCLFAVALILAYYLRARFPWLDLPGLTPLSEYIWLLPVVALLGPWVLTGQGLYAPPRPTTRLGAFFTIVINVIGGAQAMLGTLLQIKPVLTVHDGRVEPLERVRTRRKALDRMVELVSDHVSDKPYTMALGYVGPPDDARNVGEQIRRARPQVRDSYLSPVTPVVATHTGPGTVGLVYYVHGEND